MRKLESIQGFQVVRVVANCHANVLQWIKMHLQVKT